MLAAGFISTGFRGKDRVMGGENGRGRLGRILTVWRQKWTTHDTSSVKRLALFVGYPLKSFFFPEIAVAL